MRYPKRKLLLFYGQKDESLTAIWPDGKIAEAFPKANVWALPSYAGKSYARYFVHRDKSCSYYAKYPSQEKAIKKTMKHKEAKPIYIGAI